MKLFVTEFLRVFLWWLIFILIIMVKIKYVYKVSCTAYEHKNIYVDTGTELVLLNLLLKNS